MTTVAGMMPVQPAEIGYINKADGIKSHFAVTLSADADEWSHKRIVAYAGGLTPAIHRCVPPAKAECIKMGYFCGQSRVSHGSSSPVRSRQEFDEIFWMEGMWKHMPTQNSGVVLT